MPGGLCVSVQQLLQHAAAYLSALQTWSREPDCMLANLPCRGCPSPGQAMARKVLPGQRFPLRTHYAADPVLTPLPCRLTSHFTLCAAHQAAAGQGLAVRAAHLRPLLVRVGHRGPAQRRGGCQAVSPVAHRWVPAGPPAPHPPAHLQPPPRPTASRWQPCAATGCGKLCADQGVSG